MFFVIFHAFNHLFTPTKTPLVILAKYSTLSFLLKTQNINKKKHNFMLQYQLKVGENPYYHLTI